MLHSQLLSLERLAQTTEWLCAALHIERIKLTGGEPLVRTGLPALVERLSAIPRVREVSLTTNGALLRRHAGALKAAGLTRVTISLDSLDAGRYRELTCGGRLGDTLDGVTAAQETGLAPIKLNSVLLASTWRSELPLLLDFAAARGLELRLIELMRTGTQREWCNAEFVPAQAVREWLSEQTTVLPILTDSCAPARLTRVNWNGGSLKVGWIAPRSRPFCHACDRLRMDARGRLHRCLMDPVLFDLASVWSAEGEPAALSALVSYLGGKETPKRMEKSSAMISIGG